MVRHCYKFSFLLILVILFEKFHSILSEDKSKRRQKKNTTKIKKMINRIAIIQIITNSHILFK